MNDSEKGAMILGIAIGSIVMYLVLTFIALPIKVNAVKVNMAKEYNLGHYDTKTGDFIFDEVKKEDKQ